jgi:hypothetical protein
MSKEINKSNEETSIVIPAPKREVVRLRAIGISPLVCNCGKNIASKLIDNQGIVGDNAPKGKKRDKRVARNIEDEYNSARYIIDDKTDGFPAHRIKNAAIATANTFISEVSKVFVRGALFIQPEYKGWLLRIDNDQYPPEVHESTERVGGKGPGTGTPDLRWRPIYRNWSMPFTVEYLSNIITLPNLINLLNTAGMCAGLGEHRPERGGDWGRFYIISEEQYQTDKKSKK